MRVRVRECVCVRERDSECVCEKVCERERDSECVCVRKCVCFKEKEREIVKNDEFEALLMMAANLRKINCENFFAFFIDKRFKMKP